MQEGPELSKSSQRTSVLKGKQTGGEQEAGGSDFFWAAAQEACGARQRIEPAGGDFRGQGFKELERMGGHVYIVYILYYSPDFSCFQAGSEATSWPMGYPVKIQKVERPTNRSYYVNFPVALAQAIGLEKAENFEWWIEDKNTLILQRSRTKTLRKLKFKKT
jgi:hypothetical protein